jgi:prepilin-type N-terminal cleavage/methylation domain-containing protein
MVGCAMGRPEASGAARGSTAPGDEGFSLVEVMVAMGIFLIVSAATLGLIMSSLQTVRGNSNRVYAAALARAEVDNLRTLGSSAIPLGASSREVPSGSGSFTVTRTATWVDIGATTNPCQVGPGVSPGRSYLRVTVDVEGKDLGAPQTIEAIVYPNDTAPTENTGTLTVAVNDDVGEPVAGVTVTGTNGVGQTFQQVTGPDGCIFVPDLVVGGNWTVTIAKTGFITEQLDDTTASGVVVGELQNTPLAFDFAAAGSITFTAGSGGFPVPVSMPFEFTPDTRDRAPTSFAAFPVTVTGLWPDDYTGWLRPCVGAGDGSVATGALAAGGSTTLDLGGARVQLVGPEGAQVTAAYAGSCSASYPIGEWDDGLLLKSSLPAGTWTFTADGATPASQTVVLAPEVGLCSVSFDVPGAIDPNASPAPETPSPSPEPSASESGEPSPEPTVVLPEVSDPCPPAP